MRKRSLLALLGVTALAAATFAAPAQAAGETVNVWLTTTSDAGGRQVTRGLQQQTPVTFASGTGTGGVTINVNENITYQQFEGGGASFTDTAAWLMNSSGALSQATRDDTMRKLFDPNNGIGLSFIRNPLGASDLARYSYTFDDMPAGQTDPNLTHFSIAHDQADVLPLTKQAKQLNPQAKVMASPWSAPPWMKDNDSYLLGWVESQYYPAYAQYFVKYLQAYQAAGVPIDYVSMQNEPTCCSSYPSTNWNGAGLAYFAKNNLLPALQGAGLSTKVLALDWNWDTYASYGAPTLDDSAIRTHPNFGGVAWHGYGGDIAQQTTTHNQYPSVNADLQPAGRGHEQHRGLHPELVEELRQVEPRRRPEHGPAQRRLRHLHRPDHRPQRRLAQRAGRLHRRVLHDGPPDEVREARRVPDRLERQLDRAQRRLEEPGRLEGADRVQLRHRQPERPGELGQLVVHLLPARPHVGDVHLGRQPGQRRQHRQDRPDHRPRRQVPGRRERQQRERRRGPALRLQRLGRPAVDGRHRRHAPRAGQVPRRHRTVHSGRCAAAAVGLRRDGQPEMGGDSGQGHRRSGVEQVPRRDRQLLRQRHPAADLDVHRRGQPEVERPRLTQESS
jgi:O-glycosyl hydrolase